PLPQHDDRHVALAPRDVESDVAAVPPQEHIGHAASGLQPANIQLIEKLREHRLVKADLTRLLIETDTEARLYECEDRGAGPGLRRARDRIKRWRVESPRREAAEQFGQAAQVHIPRGVKHPLKNLEHFGL